MLEVRRDRHLPLISVHLLNQCCSAWPQYDTELESLINRGEELRAGQRECELRAAAIVACDQIVMASDGRIGTLELDFYLWRMGKEDRFRGLERHATRDTFFY